MGKRLQNLSRVKMFKNRGKKNRKKEMGCRKGRSAKLSRQSIRFTHDLAGGGGGDTGGEKGDTWAGWGQGHRKLKVKCREDLVDKASYESPPSLYKVVERTFKKDTEEEKKESWTNGRHIRIVGAGSKGSTWT